MARCELHTVVTASAFALLVRVLSKHAACMYERLKWSNMVLAVRRGGSPRLAVAVFCCVHVASAQYNSCNGTVANIGDGQCDQSLNTPNCGWDGGDVSSS